MLSLFDSLTRQVAAAVPRDERRWTSSYRTHYKRSSSPTFLEESAWSIIAAGPSWASLVRQPW